MTQDYLRRFHIALGLLIEAAHIWFIPVQYSMDYSSVFRLFATCEFIQILVKGIHDTGLHPKLFKHHHVRLIEDGPEMVRRAVGDI